MVDRLTKDGEKRQKNKERDLQNKFEYKDNVIVKKDVYYEYDYQVTLRSDRPGDRDERLRQFSPGPASRKQ